MTHPRRASGSRATTARAAATVIRLILLGQLGRITLALLVILQGGIGAFADVRLQLPLAGRGLALLSLLPIATAVLAGYSTASRLGTFETGLIRHSPRLRAGLVVGVLVACSTGPVVLLARGADLRLLELTAIEVSLALLAVIALGALAWLPVVLAGFGHLIWRSTVAGGGTTDTASALLLPGPADMTGVLTVAAVALAAGCYVWLGPRQSLPV
ncbi:MAG: hypothetical protein JWN95_1870 [Frankiales bacterium]|nr:hypothetical protein [Frankiales bacterium]